jgi:hypothetical protein
MTHKAITLKFVVPTMLAIALGIMLSIGVVYLTVKYLVLIDQSDVNRSAAGSRGIAELPNPDGKLSRVHLLLSRMNYQCNFESSMVCFNPWGAWTNDRTRSFRLSTVDAGRR